MKKAFIFLLALTAALAVFAACEGSAAANGPGGEPGSARDSEISAEAPTAELTAVPTEPPSQVIEMLEVRRQCIVNDPEVGTVYISPDGDMFAIDGENKDGIFGNADCESYGDPGVCFIKAGSTPALLDTGVEKACMLFYSRREYKYDGEYGESLIYLKNDGTVWLRGSNIKGIFGSFNKATEPVKLLDGAVNIGSDGRSVAAGMEDGSILAWDMTVDNGGKPLLIAEHADVYGRCGKRDNAPTVCGKRRYGKHLCRVGQI